MPRLITTGSRKFTDLDLIRRVLAGALKEHGPGLLVVEGEAPGADRLVKKAATQLGLRVEQVPARWSDPCRETCKPGHRKRRWDGSTYCPAAGDYRNQVMVDRGGIACVGFLVNPRISPCKGTRNCMRRAAAAEIPIRAFPPEFA